MATITDKSNFVDKSITYNWKINNFQNCPLYVFWEEGKINSSTFVFEGTVYHLEIKLKKEQYGCSQALYLNRNCKLSEETFEIVTIFVKGKNDRKINSSVSKLFGNETVLEIPLTYDEIMEMIKEKCITIQCDITYRCLSHSTSIDRKAEENLGILSKDLQTLLTSASLSDLYLKVGSKKIAAHSVILSARSPVFAAMLKTDMLESRSRNVVIPDFSSVAVTNMLKYIYSGKLDLKDMPSSLLSEMYAIADKYALLDLKEMCRQSMMSDLKIEKIDDYLLKAVEHDDKGMLEFIGDFLADNPQSIPTLQREELVKEIPDFLDRMLLAIKRKYASPTLFP